VEHSEITSYINLVFIFINIVIGIYSFNSNKKSSHYNPIITKLLENVFIPFQNIIGKNLFRKITKDNAHIIHRSLECLFKEIYNNDLQFGLSYQTTYYLERIIDLGVPENEHHLKRYNYEYTKFSTYYYQEQNKFRKKSGLPKYTGEYRISFKLYRNKFWEIRYYIGVFLFALAITLGIFAFNFWLQLR
jgi:hypothetical protein